MTNILPPYLVEVFRELAAQLGDFRLLLSVAMENDRAWPANWDDLHVTVQKSLTMTVRQRHPQGFVARVERHFPYDTLPLLRKASPDVVVSAQLGFRTLQSVLYRIIFRCSRLVIWVDASEHTEKRIGLAQTLMRRFLLNQADAVLAVGQSGGRYVEKLKIPRSRIIEIPFVTDTVPFQSQPLCRDEDARYRLIYVGQLIERKGLFPFLSELVSWAIAHPERKCELWLVGDGPLRPSLERLERPKNLSLRFVGNVPYASLPQFYAQAGICILPTLADTWGLVVNEALAAGVPVLGSCYSQAVEHLVRDGENGWNYFPDRLGGTRRVIERALSATPQHLARMRQAARASVAGLTPQYAACRLLRAISLAWSGGRSDIPTRVRARNV